VWSVSGKFERSIATPAHPRDVLLVSTGGTAGKLLALAMCNDHRVHVIDAQDGRVLRSIGQQGSGDGQFWSLWGAAVCNGELLVCDYHNNRIAVMK